MADRYPKADKNPTVDHRMTARRYRSDDPPQAGGPSALSSSWAFRSRPTRGVSTSPARPRLPASRGGQSVPVRFEADRCVSPRVCVTHPGISGTELIADSHRHRRPSPSPAPAGLHRTGGPTNGLLRPILTPGIGSRDRRYTPSRSRCRRRRASRRAGSERYFWRRTPRRRTPRAELRQYSSLPPRRYAFE